jgi:hypothetical protein
MVRKTVRWIPIPALLFALAWRPSANYQILLHFVVCAGAIRVILALFFIKHRIGTHHAVDNRPELGEQITVRL